MKYHYKIMVMPNSANSFSTDWIEKAHVAYDTALFLGREFSFGAIIVSRKPVIEVESIFGDDRKFDNFFDES